MKATSRMDVIGIKIDLKATDMSSNDTTNDPSMIHGRQFMTADCESIMVDAPAASYMP